MWYLLCLAIGLLINNKCIDCATEATISREEFENLKTTVNRQSEQIHQLLGFISSFTSENQRHENSEDNVKSPAIERSNTLSYIYMFINFVIHAKLVLKTFSRLKYFSLIVYS
jgi:hypothetical protein